MSANNSLIVTDNSSKKMVRKILIVVVLCLLISYTSCIDHSGTSNDGVMEIQVQSLRSTTDLMRVPGFCKKGYVYLGGIGCRKSIRRG